MNIIIRNSSTLPIYRQIYTQLRALILSGALTDGDALPSIRALAKDLRISVITTKRAYEELEKDGFINTVAGKGCYVAEKNLDILREGYLKEIEGHMEGILRLAPLCNLTHDDVIEMFHVIKEENEK